MPLSLLWRAAAAAAGRAPCTAAAAVSSRHPTRGGAIAAARLLSGCVDGDGQQSPRLTAAGGREQCSEWSVAEVARWLRWLGMAQCAPAFAEERINGELVFGGYLDNTTLEELGMASATDRRQFLAAASDPGDFLSATASAAAAATAAATTTTATAIPGATEEAAVVVGGAGRVQARAGGNLGEDDAAEKELPAHAFLSPSASSRWLECTPSALFEASARRDDNAK